MNNTLMIAELALFIAIFTVVACAVNFFGNATRNDRMRLARLCHGNAEVEQHLKGILSMERLSRRDCIKAERQVRHMIKARQVRETLARFRKNGLG